MRDAATLRRAQMGLVRTGNVIHASFPRASLAQAALDDRLHWQAYAQTPAQPFARATSAKIAPVQTAEQDRANREAFQEWCAESVAWAPEETAPRTDYGKMRRDIAVICAAAVLCCLGLLGLAAWALS